MARLASRNPHKLEELRAALTGWRIEPWDGGELPAEDGSTYYENARVKARAGRSDGLWSLGEDSGIEVAGLGGRPGIRSARYAGDGEDPVEKLLAELDGVTGPAREARYACELVAVSPDGEEVRGTGILPGRIADEARGSEGFGYDPIFVPTGEEHTVAELGNAWKREHSHRARAAKALLGAVPGPG
jgi:XTP/dITP diphosphohydrolase